MNDNAPKQQQKPSTSDVRWYPIKSISFTAPTSLPGGVTQQLNGTITQENVPRWIIEHAPQWRVFRVTFLSTNPKDEPQVRMMPETSVRVWEPMP